MTRKPARVVTVNAGNRTAKIAWRIMTTAVDIALRRRHDLEVSVATMATGRTGSRDTPSSVVDG